jgi:hypothetical protein
MDLKQLMCSSERKGQSWKKMNNIFRTHKSPDTLHLETAFTYLIKKCSSLFESEFQFHIHNRPLVGPVLSHINRVDVLAYL